MVTYIRNISASQWIMLMALAMIGTCMMVATTANAYYYKPYYGYASSYYIKPNPAAQTIGHCGWVPAANRLYYKRGPRNVHIIQTKLETLGYSVGSTGVDGRYGPRTRHAVRKFQAEHNLAVDGQVGPETATKLAYQSHPLSYVRHCRRPYMARR